MRARIDGAAARARRARSRWRRPQKHDIDVVVDRIAVREPARARLAESIETALRLADGLVAGRRRPGARASGCSPSSNACADCGVSFPEIAPRLFSFNSPHGACPALRRASARATRSTRRASCPTPTRPLAEAHRAVGRPPGARALLRAAARGARDALRRRPRRRRGASCRSARATRSCSARDEAIAIASGRGKRADCREARLGRRPRRARAAPPGVGRGAARHFATPQPLPRLRGLAAAPRGAHVRVGGRSIDELARSRSPSARPSSRRSRSPRARAPDRGPRPRARSASGCASCSTSASTTSRSTAPPARSRAARRSASGSRRRWASSLIGVLYVLDEPSIGLHPRDNRRLLDTLLRLRDRATACSSSSTTRRRSAPRTT